MIELKAPTVAPSATLQMSVRGLKSATEHVGQPTVILAKTIKGYGLGESGEGKERWCVRLFFNVGFFQIS